MKHGEFAQLREFAQGAELNWGVRVAIIHDQACIQVDGHVGRTYQMLILPKGDTSADELVKIANRIGEKLSHQAIDSSFALRFGPLWSLEEWFAWASEDPLRQARGEKLAPTLWQPVVYGLEHMLALRKEVTKRFGDDIFPRWRAERRRWRKKLWAWQNRQQKKAEKIHREREVVLNKRERHLLSCLAERTMGYYIEGRKFIVGLDGSGRPVAKATFWYLGELGLNDIRIDFLDIHPLMNRLRDLSDKKRVLSRFARVFQREKPILYQWLANRSKEILFLDDQIGYGHSSEALLALCDHVAAGGKTQAMFECLCPYSSESPPPSWWRKRKVQGIRLVSKRKTSLTAVEVETERSREFYQSLQTFMNSLAGKRRRKSAESK